MENNQQTTIVTGVRPGKASSFTDHLKMTPKGLEAFMRRHMLSDRGLADLLGITVPAVHHWIAGRRHVPPTTVKVLHFFDRYPQFMTEF